jgi:hypothetical protein
MGDIWVMRINYILKNSILGFGILILTMSIGIIRRSVMLKVLGPDLVGLNALFSDVVGFLNMADIGTSGAIGAALYKPINDRNFMQIKGILNYYKKIYLVLGTIFVIFEGILTIFICFIIEHPGISDHDVRIYFVLVFINVALTFFLAHRFILIATDQKLYKFNVISLIFKFASALLEIILLLYFTKSFFVYLLIELFSNLLVIVIQNWLIKRNFKELDTVQPVLDITTKNQITRSLKGYGFHRAGSVAVFGTNYIYTALFSGLLGAAMYSNYQLLISAMTNLSGNIFSAVSSSIGNIIVTESKERAYNLFKIILFVNFWICSLVTILFYNSSTAFVTAWIGSEYVASSSTILLFTAYYFFTSIRSATEVFKGAGGLFYEDRLIPIFEAGLNFIACITLGYKYGLSGVLAGNLLSTLAIITWQKPYIVFKYIFQRNLKDYFKDFLLYLFIGVIALFLSNFICRVIALPMNFLGFLGNSLLSLFIINGFYILVFWKTEVFKQAMGYFQKAFKMKRESRNLSESNNNI